MGIDVANVRILTTTLSSESARALFTTISRKGIADLELLKKVDTNADEVLNVLLDADLIDANSDGKKYFMTAKGLKIARDLESLALR